MHERQPWFHTCAQSTCTSLSIAAKASYCWLQPKPYAFGHSTTMSSPTNRLGSTDLNMALELSMIVLCRDLGLPSCGRKPQLVACGNVVDPSGVPATIRHGHPYLHCPNCHHLRHPGYPNIHCPPLLARPPPCPYPQRSRRSLHHATHSDNAPNHCTLSTQHQPTLLHQSPYLRHH